MLSRNYIQAKLQGAFTGNQAAVLAELLFEAQGDATTVNAALTALAAKLNADATVTDTDYAGATLTEQGLD